MCSSDLVADAAAIDLSGNLATGNAAAIKALTLDIGGVDVDLSGITLDDTNSGADAIAAIQGAIDAAVTAANAAGAAGTANYNKVENVQVKANGTTGFTVTFDSTPQTYKAAAAAAGGKAEIDFGTGTGADVIGRSITVGDKTYEFVATGGDVTTTGNVKVEVGETDAAAAIATALKTAAAAAAPTGVAGATGVAVNGAKVTFTTTATGADAEIAASEANNTPDAPKLSGDYNVSTTVLQKKADGAGERLASTYFDLTKEMAGNGSSITIGKTAYTFTTDAADKALITANTDNKVYVGDLDLTTKEGLTTAAERLTNVAKANTTYTVGHDGKRLTFTEKIGRAHV